MNHLLALHAANKSYINRKSDAPVKALDRLPVEVKRQIIDYVETADLPHLVEAVPAMMVDAPNWSFSQSRVADHYPKGFLSGDPAQAWCLGEQLYRAEKNLWKGHIYRRHPNFSMQMVAGATSGDLLFHFFDGHGRLTAHSSRRQPILISDTGVSTDDRETGEMLFEVQPSGLAESPSGRWLTLVGQFKDSRMLAFVSENARAVQSLPTNNLVTGLPLVVPDLLVENYTEWPRKRKLSDTLLLLDLACYPPSSIALCSGTYTQGSDLLFSVSSTHLLLVHRDPDLRHVYGRLSLLRLPSPAAPGAWCTLPLGFQSDADVTPLIIPVFGQTIVWLFVSANDRNAAYLLSPTFTGCDALRLPLKAVPTQADAVVSLSWKNSLIRIDNTFFLVEQQEDRPIVVASWQHLDEKEARLDGVSFRFLPQLLTYALWQPGRQSVSWYEVRCQEERKKPLMIHENVQLVQHISRWSWCGSPSTMSDSIDRFQFPMGAVYLARRDDRFFLEALLRHENSWTICPLGPAVFSTGKRGVVFDVDRTGGLLACSSTVQDPVVITLPGLRARASFQLLKPMSPAWTSDFFFSKIADVVLATMFLETWLATQRNPDHSQFTGIRPNPLASLYSFSGSDDDELEIPNDGEEQSESASPKIGYEYGLHAWRVDEANLGQPLWLRGIREGDQEVQSTKDGTAFCLLDMGTQEIVDFVG